MSALYFLDITDGAEPKRRVNDAKIMPTKPAKQATDSRWYFWHDLIARDTVDEGVILDRHPQLIVDCYECLRMKLITIHAHATHATGHRSSPYLKLLKPDRSTPHQPLGLRGRSLSSLATQFRYACERTYSVVRQDCQFPSKTEDTALAGSKILPVPKNEKADPLRGPAHFILVRGLASYVSNVSGARCCFGSPTDSCVALVA
jgi:hypothetical protein